MSAVTDSVLKENGYDPSYRAQGAGVVRPGKTDSHFDTNYTPILVGLGLTLLIVITTLLILILFTVKKKSA